MKKTSIKSALLFFTGLAFCVIPPLAAVLCYFPIWQARGGESILSGFTLLLMLLAVFPLFNVIKKLLRSPAAHTMWFIAFIIFFILSNIAREMTVISFTGFIGNLIGAFLFKLSGGGDHEE